MAIYFEHAFPELGASVFSNIIFHEIINATGFENDKKMKNLLKMFLNAFINVIETENGKLTIHSLETVVQSIKDETTFISSVKSIVQLVQKFGLCPTDEFGLFLGCLGIIIALASQLDPTPSPSIGLQRIISQTYELIFCTVLVPLWNGTNNAIENFFACDFIDALSVDNELIW